MALDLEQLQEIANIEPVVRILVADHKGSVPRETGCSMLCTATGQFGTIGGGALEYLAVAHARKMMAAGKCCQLKTIPLGPALSQCCGGSVKLSFETFTSDNVPKVTGYYSRALTERPASLRVARHLKALETGAIKPSTQLIDGYLFEEVSEPKQPLWIYGAGHVGRAIIAAIHGLPFEITWIDTADTRYPYPLPDDVSILIAKAPAQVVKHAPREAIHLVLTYSHTLDLEICNAVLARRHKMLGLIGSKTKRVRFTKRLTELGHTANAIAQMHCPIGDPNLGKHPKSIAIGVAAQLLLVAKQRTQDLKEPKDV